MAGFAQRSPRSRGSARRTGLLVAGGVGLASLAILAVFALLYRSQPAANIDNAPPTDAPPDIKSLGGRGSSVSGLSNAALGRTTGWFIEVPDRDNPRRRAAVYLAEASEPLPNRQYRLTKPQAWSFANNGRAIHVAADRGEALIPSNDKNARPQTATLEGSVRISLFEPSPTSPAAAPAPTPADFDSRAADVVVSTSSLRYEETPGRIAAPDRFVLSHPRFTFAGRGLTLLINDVERRVEYLKVERAEPGLTFLVPEQAPSAPAAPTQPDATPASPSPTSSPTAASPTSSSPAKSGDSSEVFYHLTVTDSVKVTFEDRTITADHLEVWARLRDNALAPDAIASPKIASTTGSPTRTDSPSTPAPQLAQPSPSSPLADRAPTSPLDPASAPETTPRSQTLITADGREILLTWSGALELRPLAGKPPQLAADELALRFRAGEDSAVRLDDPAAKLAATCDTLEYGATSTRVILAGSATRPARLIASDAGSAQALRFEINLTNGRTVADGPGLLRPIAAADREQSIAWSGLAEFRFRVEESGLTSRLIAADFRGGVIALDDEASLRAEHLIATFDARAADSSPIIATLAAETSVYGDDGRGGSLASDSLSVRFRDLPGRERPIERLLASGNVKTTRGSDVLTAANLDVTFRNEPGADRSSEVDTVVATGQVRYDGPDGIFINGDTLNAKADSDFITVTGPRASIGQGDSAAYGREIQLTGGESRRIVINGPGEFRHRATGDNDAVVTASGVWTIGMAYDDATGSLDARGGIAATLTTGATRVDKLTAESLVARFERSSAGQTSDNPTPDAARPGDFSGRSLVEARFEGVASTPATIESRRLSATDPGTVLGLAFLQGSPITLDQRAKTLSVPGPGTLFASDRNEAPAAAPSDPPTPAGGGRGDTRFRWTGSLLAARSTGQITITGDVKARHLDASTQVLTDLEADSVSAVLRSLRQTGASVPTAEPPEPAGQLESATASGRVWVRSGGRELSSLSATFNALTGEVEAAGDDSTDATLFDAGQGAPLAARRLLWNINTGRIEIRQPSTIVTPR